MVDFIVQMIDFLTIISTDVTENNFLTKILILVFKLGYINR